MLTVLFRVNAVILVGPSIVAIMDIVWEDPPVPDTPFFTRDLYEKYSLAPNIRELWAFLQSPVENASVSQECDVRTAKPSCPPFTQESAEFKDKSCISKEESHGDSYTSDELCADNSVESTEECKGAKKSEVKLKQLENEADAAFPAPRLHYPCLSMLSAKEQMTYLNILMSKKAVVPPQRLMERINREVMEFTNYLQAVARRCSDDYNFISQGAMQYSEDFLRDCLKCVDTIPQLYQIHEMTSLTGGTFNPGLTLTFEKQLLIMGSVDITDHTIVPADAQLASDYQSVSSVNPPAKKAKDMHATVSTDSNAEKLCSRYEPHVCLTRDALVRLLDNHGPDFGEQWEVPVWVKSNPAKGSSLSKTVYIDPPLLKTEMTVRERSHIYHEESLKLSIKKNGRKNVFHVMTELPVNEQRLSAENSQRSVTSLNNDGLDFEVDLADLETFGESTQIKTPKETQKEQAACAKSKIAASSPPLIETKGLSEPLVNTSSGPQDVTTASPTDMQEAIAQETIQPVVCETIGTKIAQKRPDSALTYTRDSDDETLVIDVSLTPAASPTTLPGPKTTPCTTADSAATAASETDPVQSETSSPSPKAKRQRQQSRMAKVSGDQLSEILRMQTAMFNSTSDTAKGSTTSQETNSPPRCMGAVVHPHPMSLVKPCVSSYLERNQNQDGETNPPHESEPMVNFTTTEHKKILSQDLQAGAEDEQDYEAPEEGNLLYKLYSLQDLLLMVRSSVSLTHTRKVGAGQNQYVPVHVLPKLEYQLCYGVECLSSSEACQLWTETQLHSSTASYTAHINAFTSKVALLRKLPDNWKQSTSCGFKPSKSLNILHHLLKKLTGLEEGRYLILHKAGEPFVTLLKAANGKVTRRAYNLQQIHSSVPQPPSSGLVPWIPVDPAVVLPFHKKHGQVPCTFPVKPPKDGSSSNNQGGGQQNISNAGGKTQKKKRKRAFKRNKYMKKLIQKSI